MSDSTYTIGYFVGSLASDSINRRLSEALIRLAPHHLTFTEVPIDKVPLYSRDYDASFPSETVELKESIEAVDGILFITPEYNRDIPGALKNAIDWASRPWGENSFARKPSAVIGASVGKIGTAVAQQNLRSVLSYLDSPQMNAPEAYIEFTDGLVDDEGRVTVADTEEFLRTFMSEFATFVERVLTVLPRND